MLDIEFNPDFLKTLRKIKNAKFKDTIKKQVEKVIDDPSIGKPMRYSRKGTREVYIKPYRLAYALIPEEDKLIILGLYHKDEQ